jgi:small subunit ribosomal protein S20
MASHKSAKKRMRTSARKRIINKMRESRIKTVVKKALNATKKAEAEKLYKDAVSLLDRNTVKGKIHRNTAARKKAALTKHLNKLTLAK